MTLTLTSTFKLDLDLDLRAFGLGLRPPCEVPHKTVDLSPTFGLEHGGHDLHSYDLYGDLWPWPLVPLAFFHLVINRVSPLQPIVRPSFDLWAWVGWSGSTKVHRGLRWAWTGYDPLCKVCMGYNGFNWVDTFCDGFAWVEVGCNGLELLQWVGMGSIGLNHLAKG